MPLKSNKARAIKIRESKIYGLNAAVALSNTRPQDIIRVYLTKERLKKFSTLLKQCAMRKLAYHIVSDAEVEKVSGSIHHEGICILAKEKNFLLWQTGLGVIKKSEKRPNIVLLDGLQNPHNIGAIARTAAYFGIEMLITNTAANVHLSGSLARTSEGASELLTFVRCDSMPQACTDLRRLGYYLIATSPHSKKALEDFTSSTLSVSDLTPIFVFGAEGKGISNEVLKVVDQIISVPGCGAIESLNVSSTAAICLSAFYRSVKTRPAKEG